MLARQKNLITLGLLIVPIALLLTAVYSGKQYRERNQSAFIEDRIDVMNSWIHARFVDLDDPLVLDHGIHSIRIQGDSLLDPDEERLLRESIKTGLLAFSQGGESNYIKFRFPPGVPWVWKTNAAIGLSNYFKIGTVFSGGSDYLAKRWVRKYGHPDRIVHFIPWAEAIKKSIGERPESIDEFKKYFIKDYGPGVDFDPPEGLFDQWKLMCFDLSDGTWYQGMWIKFYPETSVVLVSNFTNSPPFYDAITIEKPFSSKGDGVDSGFSNLGIDSLASTSFIEWDQTVEDLISRYGSVKIAHVLLTILQKEPFPPTRYIFRMVYRKDFSVWVPYDLVNCSIPSSPSTMNIFW